MLFFILLLLFFWSEGNIIFYQFHYFDNIILTLRLSCFSNSFYFVYIYRMFFSLYFLLLKRFKIFFFL
ncbi:hypothetical protein BDC45DRAFT_507109 [Circinella umbellata]|nr:hypothetical protein BDC45DRAFT_507109 [Circinella umbellata]